MVDMITFGLERMLEQGRGGSPPQDAESGPHLGSKAGTSSHPSARPR
jgi:hypothetical protein